LNIALQQKGSIMSGIHHVTAISGSANRNLDFYTSTLGLRLVKKTVNFDDPGTYHLYYGDETGQPGTILTFFPWEHAAPGQGGVGQTQQTVFRVPSQSIGYWTHRLIEKGVKHETPSKRFGQSIIEFSDTDGLRLALVGLDGAEGEPARGHGDVPQEHAIRGFHGVTLLLETAEPTADVLTRVLGFAPDGKDEGLRRYKAGGPIGGYVDIQEAKGFLRGRMGRGSVHHVAFRAKDDAEQTAMAKKLIEDHGLHPTHQLDRQYFRSIYFQEPGGILFEIATDEPGFAIDESVETLGTSLKLPAFLENRRSKIEAMLPALEVSA
jgi:glyoxalase family protein